MKSRIIFVLVLFSSLYLKSIAQGFEITTWNSNEVSFPFWYHSDSFKILNNGHEGVFTSVYIPSASNRRNGTKPKIKVNNQTPADKTAGKKVSLIPGRAKSLPDSNQLSITFIWYGEDRYYEIKKIITIKESFRTKYY